MMRHLIGIDEVGRGPLAGPVTVAAVLLRCSRLKTSSLFKGIKDSKQLSALEREEWRKRFLDYRKRNLIDWKISFVTPEVIDRVGIARAIKMAVARSVSRLSKDPLEIEVLLDGGLRAPERFIFQKTIIRGDEKVPLIAAASILAKVHRDRRMRELSKIYPEYGFEQHKGYGTKAHIKMIKSFGYSPIHRRSFSISVRLARRSPLG